MNAVLWALGGAGAGAIAGSFIATLVVRWPAGRSIARGRSGCDACGGTLGAAELVPVLSFLALGGRCARCATPIDRRHLVIELAGAAIGALALAVAPGWAGAAGALFGWFLLALGALDLEHFWLPDALTAPLGALGLLAGAAGLSPALPDRAIGAGAGFTALWSVAALYRRVRGRDGLGGGDPKLFAAIGAWLGWAALPWVLLIAASGGLGFVGIAALRGHRVTATTRVPFGVLLAGAGFAAWAAISTGVLPPR